MSQTAVPRGQTRPDHKTPLPLADRLAGWLVGRAGGPGCSGANSKKFVTVGECFCTSDEDL